MKPVIVVISVAVLFSSVFGDYNYYCPEPEVPTYGYISKGKQNTYEVGDEIEYTCKDGYKLIGEKRIRCASQGETEYWDGATPECKKGKWQITELIQLHSTIYIYAFQTIKTDVEFSILPTMARFGTKGQKSDRRQFIHANVVTTWKGNVSENASTMAPGQAMSLSASLVS